MTTPRLTLIASNPDVVLHVDGKHIRIRDISAIEPSVSRLIALVHLVGGARLEVRLYDAVPIHGPMLEMLELAKAAESDDPKLSIAFTALGCAAFLLFLPTFLLFMAAGGALLVAIVNI